VKVEETKLKRRQNEEEEVKSSTILEEQDRQDRQYRQYSTNPSPGNQEINNQNNCEGRNDGIIKEIRYLYILSFYLDCKSSAPRSPLWRCFGLSEEHHAA
jgi:hypothetical protein